jgi:hypothetical protein
LVNLGYTNSVLAIRAPRIVLLAQLFTLHSRSVSEVSLDIVSHPQ